MPILTTSLWCALKQTHLCPSECHLSSHPPRSIHPSSAATQDSSIVVSSAHCPAAARCTTSFVALKLVNSIFAADFLPNYFVHLPPQGDTRNIWAALMLLYLDVQAMFDDIQYCTLFRDGEY